MSASNSIIVGPLVQELLAKPPEEQLPLLIEYLGTCSRAKVALAQRVLNGGGPAIVSLLIRGAFASGRRPMHTMAILEIVAQIGEPLGLDSVFRSVRRRRPNG